MLSLFTPLVRRIFEVSRSKWWQLVAGPLIAALAAFLAVAKTGDRQLTKFVIGVAAVIGFFAVLLLLARDAIDSMKRNSGAAGLTPAGFIGDSLVADAMDHAAILAEIERTVGTPPRRGSPIAAMYRTPTRPAWMTRDDLNSTIYNRYREIVDRGEVRWAAIIHANYTLYTPGTIASGAQVVYAEENVPLAKVQAWARACYAVKNTTPADPAVRKIADMLTDEMERALDWPVPATLCGGAQAITTVVMMQRELLPLGFLTCRFVPVFADPVSKLAVLVPSGWWPAPLVNYWVSCGQALDALKKATI